MFRQNTIVSVLGDWQSVKNLEIQNHDIHLTQLLSVLFVAEKQNFLLFCCPPFQECVTVCASSVVHRIKWKESIINAWFEIIWGEE